jgi:hypothetical protein
MVEAIVGKGGQERVPTVGLTRLAPEYGGDGMKFGHDTVMGVVLVISGGLTFAYTRAKAPSRMLLILTIIGAATAIIIGLLLFFRLA